MLNWSLLLKPKTMAAITAVAVVASAGLYIYGEILRFGQARYDEGKADCERAVRIKTAEAKVKLDAAKAVAAAEAAKTETVYVEVIKRIAVVDAVTEAENRALRNEIQLLEGRIENAQPDISACAGQPIPADSLSIHTKIDRLLRDN